jgi:molecular chaperone GrpE
MEKLKPGIYRHYKGNEYRLLEEALDADNQELIVVYQDLKDLGKIWTRKKEEFMSEVNVAGETKPRFEFIREAENDSCEEKYLRALADYQNLLKQTDKEKAEFAKYALNDFLQNVLPVYDHLKMAMNGLSVEENKNPWAEGVKHVLKQFKEILVQHGIEEIKTIGERFDHETMEALEGSGESVVKEVRPGYKLNGKVIRHAKVITE